MHDMSGILELLPKISKIKLLSFVKQKLLVDTAR